MAGFWKTLFASAEPLTPEQRGQARAEIRSNDAEIERLDRELQDVDAAETRLLVPYHAKQQALQQLDQRMQAQYRYYKDQERIGGEIHHNSQHDAFTAPKAKPYFARAKKAKREHRHMQGDYNQLNKQVKQLKSELGGVKLRRRQITAEQKSLAKRSQKLGTQLQQ